MSSSAAKELRSSLGNLHISSSQSPNSKPKPKKTKVADSWEDEADASTEEDESESSTPTRPATSDLPQAPPPTPSSPRATQERGQNFQSFPPFAFNEDYDRSSFDAPKSQERRPDKTTSVASRLIAAGIGQKAPRRTAEQREYDQAMKVQEKKRRDQAKAEEEKKRKEKEQAQRDAWGD